jgi:hypothetical protein
VLVNTALAKALLVNDSLFYWLACSLYRIAGLESLLSLQIGMLEFNNHLSSHLSISLESVLPNVSNFVFRTKMESRGALRIEATFRDRLQAYRIQAISA